MRDPSASAEVRVSGLLNEINGDLVVGFARSINDEPMLKFKSGRVLIMRTHPPQCRKCDYAGHDAGVTEMELIDAHGFVLVEAATGEVKEI